MAKCKVKGFDKTQSFENQYGWYNEDTGNITINEPRIYETLATNVDPYARQIAALTPLHELTHREIATKKLFIGTDQEKLNVNLAAQGLLEEIQVLTANGTIKKALGELFIKRIEGYSKQVKEGGTYDEFLTSYVELMVMTGINSKKWTNLAGMRQVLDDVFRKVGKDKWSKIVNPFNTTSLIKSFLANWLDRVQQYKGIKAGDEEKEEEKKEASIGDTINKGLKEDGFSFSKAEDKPMSKAEREALSRLTPNQRLALEGKGPLTMVRDKDGNLVMEYGEIAETLDGRKSPYRPNTNRFNFSRAVDEVTTPTQAKQLRQLGDQINEAVTQALADRLDKPIEELTKDDWMREGLADAYMYLIDEQGPGRDLLDNTIRQAIRKGKKTVDSKGKVTFTKPITGDNVYGKSMEGFLEDVGMQLYRRTIQRFDPSQNTDFGGFAIAELVNFRIGEILNQYAKDTGSGVTGSIETKIGDTGDLSMADRLESTELTPEEYTDQQLALERERKAVTVRQKGKAKKELPKRSAVRQDLSTLKTIDNEVKKQIREELPAIIEEVLKDPKDIKNIDQLVEKIGKKLGEKIIKKLGGTIGMKKGEFVVPKEWLEFVKNEYTKLSKGIPGRLIKKSYKDLYNITPTGEKVDVKNVREGKKDSNYRIDRFTIDQPTRTEWVDYFARPEKAKGKPVSVKNKYIARQRGLASIVVREMVKNQMKDYLSDPKNVQAIAEKINVPVAEVVIEALKDNMLEQFDYDINEQKDNLASVYSFSTALDKTPFTSLTSALNKLSEQNRMIFNQYAPTFLDEIDKIVKQKAKQFPGQELNIGVLELEQAWNQVFTDKFLGKKQKEGVIEGFSTILRFYNPKYIDLDSKKLKKQEVTNFLYNEILAQEQDYVLRNLLGLNTSSLDFNNQEQLSRAANDVANIVRGLLNENKIDEALILSNFISATWNQSGKIGKGGLTAVYDDTTNQIVYVEDASKIGSMRGSIFQGNKNFAESFLKPLFESYGIKINVINTTKDKDKKAQYKIEYIKDGVAYNFSDLVDVVPQNVLGYIEGLVNGNEIDQRDLKKSEDYAKLNQDFLIKIADYFKNKIKQIEKSKGSKGLYNLLTDLSPAQIEQERNKELAAVKNSYGMFLRSANSDMRAPIRAAFRVDSHVELDGIGIDKNFIEKYNKAKTKKDKDELTKDYFRYEHNPPARTTQIGLVEYALDNWNKARVNDMFKTGGVSLIPQLMDDQINLFNKDTVPVGVIIGDSTNSIDKFNRYYNSKLYGQFPYSLIYYKKKGKGYERVEYGAGQKEAYKQKQDIIKNNNAVVPSNMVWKPSASVDNNYIHLEQLDNLSRAQAEAKKYPVENKGISIFDFDDTVATSKSKVGVIMSDGTTFKINATEFAKQHESLVAQGAEFDFSDFNKVVDGKKGPLFTKLQKAVNKFGNENVFILTARAPEAAPAIKAFLDGLGVELKIENIVGLADGTAAAKANWVAEKAAQGYNDFYFTDDAYANVKAVQDVLDVVDLKGTTHQAQYKFSQSMDRVFNEMIERKKGIKREAVYSKAKAEVQGKKRRDDVFISSDADDFEGLLDRIAGKGKQGEADKAFIKKALHNPFGQAMAAIARDRVQLMADYKALKKQLGINPRELRKIKIKGGFNAEQAIRIYIWNKQGMEIPGLSKSDVKNAVDYIEKNINYKTYANELVAINKGDSYSKPGFGWLAGTVATDLTDGINSIKREKYLKDTGWSQNIDIILSEKNLNKLEAAYGKTYREALESFIQRMKTGRNRNYEGDSLTGNFMEWINGSVGAIMFFNTRSAILQTISAANFINWTDNNILAAGKAFANQPQFWKDFTMLFNSEFLIDRRSGLRVNLNESDLAEAAEKGGFMGAVSYILKIGFLPTQIMDSFAIASGGASFYRNRLNTYLKKGLNQKEAHDKTIEDWREISETSQQSARADKISQQQAGPLGRVILAFANTPMQYTRLMKKAALDLANGRGDWKTNVSKLIYYGAVQNLFFNATQQALFALAWGDDDEGDEVDDKYARVVNGMADSILRGTGFYGAAIAAVKNAMIKFHTESQKRRPKYENAIYELLKFSPPLGSKITKLRNWARSMTWDRDEMRKKGFSLDNPAWMAWGQVISATLNIPIDRALRKIENIRDAAHSEAEMWQRIALLGGWQSWEIGFDPEKATRLKNRKNNPNNLDLNFTLDNLDLDLNFDNLQLDIN